LNIFFGESSWDRENFGNDMIWNPTSDFGPSGNNVGGRHFVYVTRQTYDECNYIYGFLSNGTLPTSGGTGSLLYLDQNDPTTDMREAYKQVAWVGCPMLYPGFDFKDPRQIPTTARIKLRVNQPIRSRGGSTDYPIFTFNTSDLAAEANVEDVAINSLLNNVRVVPNPYYAFSKYERSQLQTIVKITNLPRQCRIKIYNLSGTLIRTYIKDSDEPSQTWDLKNAAGTPVASGAYIIHVDAGNLGETVVKFFAVMPEIDLNAF
jgi:subtilisin family serine protease